MQYFIKFVSCSVLVHLLAAWVMDNILSSFFFVIAAKDSRLFKNFPDDVLHAFATEPLTSNFHMWSLSMKVFDHFISQTQMHLLC